MFLTKQFHKLYHWSSRESSFKNVHVFPKVHSFTKSEIIMQCHVFWKEDSEIFVHTMHAQFGFMAHRPSKVILCMKTLNCGNCYYKVRMMYFEVGISKRCPHCFPLTSCFMALSCQGVLFTPIADRYNKVRCGGAVTLFLPWKLPI